MKKTRSHKPRREHAQGIVEFALVLPVLLLILFGVIEVGRLLAIYASVATASREAARYASASGKNSVSGEVFYKDCAGIEEAARRMGILVGLDSVTIQYDHGPNTGGFFDSCHSAVQVQLGDRVVVDVFAQYQPFLGLVGLPSFPIQSQTARTIVKDVKIQGTPAPLVATLIPSQTPTSAADQPVVTIVPPSDCLNGAVLPFGTVISFAGTAMDVQDGDISSKLDWFSSIDGWMSNGASFSTAALSAGAHTIIARAIDSDGNTGLANCSLVILPPFTPTPTNTPVPTETLTGTPTPTETTTPTITLTITPGPSPTPTNSLTPTSTSTNTPTPTDTTTPTPTPTNTPLPCQLDVGTANRAANKITWSLVNTGPYSYTLTRLNIPWSGAEKLTTVQFGTATLWAAPSPSDDGTDGSTFGSSAAEWIWTPFAPDFTFPAGPGLVKDLGFFWSKSVGAFSELTIAVFVNNATGTNCSVSIIFN